MTGWWRWRSGESRVRRASKGETGQQGNTPGLDPGAGYDGRNVAAPRSSSNLDKPLSKDPRRFAPRSSDRSARRSISVTFRTMSDHASQRSTHARSGSRPPPRLDRRRGQGAAVRGPAPGARRGAAADRPPAGLRGGARRRAAGPRARPPAARAMAGRQPAARREPRTSPRARLGAARKQDETEERAYRRPPPPTRPPPSPRTARRARAPRYASRGRPSSRAAGSRS